MLFSVGVLYSIQYFLEFIEGKNITVEKFSKTFYQYKYVDSNDILKTCLKYNWITVNIEGELSITEYGCRILNEKDKRKKLRLQIKDYIKIEKPIWSNLISYGRQEVLKFLSAEINQCFREAGLLETNMEVIKWWDSVGSLVRGEYSDINLEKGRYAESLSIIYEEHRTKNKPLWQSIESNKSGYDILSRINSEDDRSLKIEVKGTVLEESISFYITKNEWNIALQSKLENSYNYIFHIWSIGTNSRLFILNVDFLKNHIPENRGNGSWEIIKLNFKVEDLKKYENKIDIKSMITNHKEKVYQYRDII